MENRVKVNGESVVSVVEGVIILNKLSGEPEDTAMKEAFKKLVKQVSSM